MKGSRRWVDDEPPEGRDHALAVALPLEGPQLLDAPAAGDGAYELEPSPVRVTSGVLDPNARPSVVSTPSTCSWRTGSLAIPAEVVDAA